MDSEKYLKESFRIIYEYMERGNGQKLKEKAQSLTVTSAECRPIKYVKYEAAYEIRRGFKSFVPSRYEAGFSNTKKNVSDYDVENMPLPERKVDYNADEELFELADSIYFENCNTCGANGYTPCSCGDGLETCRECGGRGEYGCGSCNGSGEVTCDACNGYGYTVRSEQVYENDYPVLKDIKTTCYKCAGSRTLTCGVCGGSGWCTCHICRGSGSVTCHICGGSIRVVCNSCQGNGSFKDSVMIRRYTDKFSPYMICEDGRYDDNEDIYNYKCFTKFIPDDRDECLESIESKDPIYEIPGASVDYNFEGISGLFMDELPEGSYFKRIGNRAGLYTRDVYYAEFTMAGKAYKAAIDSVSKEIVFDNDPYEDALNAVHEDAMQAASDKKYKSLVNSAEEINEVAKNSAEYEGRKDINNQVEAVKKNLFLVSTLTIVIANLFFMIRARGSLIVSLIFAAISIFISRKLTNTFWKKILFDTPYVTKAILIIVNIIIAYFAQKFAYNLWEIL